MGRILLLVGVICWFALAARAEVDQAVLIPGGASFYYHNVRAPFQWAQTFTVGAAGQLAQIDLQVFKNPQAALGLTVDVRATSAADGSPQQADAPLLASVVLSPGVLPSRSYPNVQPYVPVDLRAFDIRVTPGEVLAIVLRSDEPDEPFNRGFEWSASPQGSDVYAGGLAYERFPPGQFWQAQSGSFADDQGFRTVVVAVPEPATLGVSVMVVWSIARRRPLRIFATKGAKGTKKSSSIRLEF